MRILVVTLATIENELDRCIASIQGQQGVSFEHMVLRDLPKREAHEAMFGTFMSRRDDFDLMVKVDADMVLTSPDLLNQITRRFKNHEGLKLLAIGVQDFFTNALMWSLNAYSSKIEWRRSGDKVFTDQFKIDKADIISDFDDLAPAATHCEDPSPFQAFHFGVHRGVKAVVAADRGDPGQARTRCREIDKTWKHYRKNPDRRLLLAALGGELAMVGEFGGGDLSYSDPLPMSVFERYESLDTEVLRRRALDLRAIRQKLLVF